MFILAAIDEISILVAIDEVLILAAIVGLAIEPDNCGQPFFISPFLYEAWFRRVFGFSADNKRLR